MVEDENVSVAQHRHCAFCGKVTNEQMRVNKVARYRRKSETCIEVELQFCGKVCSESYKRLLGSIDTRRRQNDDS